MRCELEAATPLAPYHNPLERPAHSNGSSWPFILLGSGAVAHRACRDDISHQASVDTEVTVLYLCQR
jgi:hypothetical protein